MNFINTFYTFFILTLLSVSAFTSNKTIIDDLGRKITIKKEPMRIISLAPNITEILFSLGLDDKLIAVSQFSDYPPKSSQKIKVGTYIKPLYEKILTLRPDIIIATAGGLNPDQGAQFTRLKLPLYVSYPKTLADIPKLCKKLATVLGVPKKGAGIAFNLQAKFDALNKEVLNYKALSGIFIIQSHPLIVAAQNTFIDDLLKQSSFINIVYNQKKRYPTLPLETLYQLNPEVIFLATFEPNEMSTFAKNFRTLNAVKKNHVFILPPNLFNRPGPRIVKALHKLVNIRKQIEHE